MFLSCPPSRIQNILFNFLFSHFLSVFYLLIRTMYQQFNYKLYILAYSINTDPKSNKDFPLVLKHLKFLFPFRPWASHFRVKFPLHNTHLLLYYSG